MYVRFLAAFCPLIAFKPMSVIRSLLADVANAALICMGTFGATFQ